MSAAATALLLAKLVIPQVAAPIQIDGELDEIAWTAPARTGQFVDASGQLASPYSDARLLRDNQFLYVAFYAADEDVRSTDAFTVTFTGSRTVTMRFAASGKSPNGIRVARDVDGSVDAPTDDDEEWLLETAIPLASIPFTSDGEVTATISRCDVTKDRVRRCGSWRGTLVKR
ncbi:MAG: hypothetical protein JO257_23780 [Deltaproteobacteria bacterium]|nr:hypothetical protein [Deltaproteobacteria bacterium]